MTHQNGKVYVGDAKYLEIMTGVSYFTIHKNKGKTCMGWEIVLLNPKTYDSENTSSKARWVAASLRKFGNTIIVTNPEEIREEVGKYGVEFIATRKPNKVKGKGTMFCLERIDR